MNSIFLTIILIRLFSVLFIMAKVSFRKDVEIDIPEAAYEYAQRPVDDEEEEEES